MRSNLANSLIGSPFVRSVLLLAMLVSTAACQTAPPVQEMSDARQAIAAARDAGAAELASEQLREAEMFLDNAERNLSERAYSMARRNANQAKSKALEALALSEHPDLNSPR